VHTSVEPPMRWPTTLLLLVAACGQPAERSEPRSEAPPATPSDHRAWLELYDEAAFPDVSALRRVELEAGQGESECAWVLSTSPLVLLQDSLWTFEPERVVSVPEYMRVPTQALDEAPREPLSYREVDFADELRTELEAVEALTEEDDSYSAMIEKLGRPTYWLVRARWAQMRGLPELSRRALSQVERWTPIDCGQEACTPQDAIRSGFQLTLLWQAIDGIDNFMPRPQVRELVARASAMAPLGVHAAQAKELLDRLDRTIATDANGPPWPNSGEPARVEQLIHLLREQNGCQRGPRGACYPFAVPASIRNPADELAARGREVIPALIEHIDDDTLTRSVEPSRVFYLPHHVLSVGDVALAIIEQLAGRNFYLPDASSSAMQQLVREWWAGVHELSEREQLLRDLDEIDDDQRSHIAHLLLDKYGMAIWPELLRVFEETKDAGERVDLLQTMNVADERETVERFLIAALEDRAASVRLVAARTLIERGRYDGTETMIRDLDSYWLTPHAWSDTSWYGDYYESYFSVLATDGSAAAVDAINRAVQRRGHAALAALRSGGCRWAEPCNPKKLDPAAKARLLDTLVDHLDDFGDPWESWGNGPARTRDMAAGAYLALTGGDVDAFASIATSIERDQAILDMLDAHPNQQARPVVFWPHLAPLLGQPGRDYVQRVHLHHAAVHEHAAHEWLAGFVGRDLNPHELSTELVGLAEHYPDIPFTVRIHRFPADAGVILSLEVGPHTSPQSHGYTATAVHGVDGVGGRSFGDKPDPKVFADFDWDHQPTRIEEYAFRIRISSGESSVLTAQGCECTSSGNGNWSWLLALAGCFFAATCRTRAARRS
jgi:hypothetical protein